MGGSGNHYVIVAVATNQLAAWGEKGELLHTWERPVPALINTRTSSVRGREKAGWTEYKKK